MEMLLILWGIFGGLGAWIADHKDRRRGEGLILGVLFGPLGVLVEALLPTGRPAQPAAPAAYQVQPRKLLGVADEVDDRHRHARWWLIAAGLVAGLLAFAIGETTIELIPADNVPVDTMGHVSMGPSEATARVAATRNGSITFGVLGICLGGCLGIAGGLVRRSVSAAVKAGLLGAVLAMVLAVAASLPLLPVFLREIPNQPDYDLILSMVMHGTIWGLIGAAAGLAFAVGLGERRLMARALLAGFAGAALGAIAFDLLGGALFPLADTGLPISITWTTRLLARLLTTVGAAILVSLTLSDTRSARSHAAA
jgi:uncharacterized membrane protein